MEQMKIKTDIKESLQYWNNQFNGNTIYLKS
jgi:hypothetical protein